MRKPKLERLICVANTMIMRLTLGIQESLWMSFQLEHING